MRFVFGAADIVTAEHVPLAAGQDVREVQEEHEQHAGKMREQNQNVFLCSSTRG